MLVVHCRTPANVILCWIVVVWEEDKLYGYSVGEEEGGGSRADWHVIFFLLLLPLAPRPPRQHPPLRAPARRLLGWVRRVAPSQGPRGETTTARASWWPASSSPSPPFPRAQARGQLRHPGVQSYCWLVCKSFASFLSLFFFKKFVYTCM